MEVVAEKGGERMGGGGGKEGGVPRDSNATCATVIANQIDKQSAKAATTPQH